MFITAHGEFAVSAFEREAIDYVLKPVTPDRVARLATRLQQRLRERQPRLVEGETAQLVSRVQSLSSPPAVAAQRIRTLRASVGTSVHMIAVADILCLEAADKYVAVVTADVEALVRISLRDLLSKMDTSDLMHIHRGTVVNTRHVVRADRDEFGTYHLVLRGLDRRLKVSRAFAHQFRPM